MKNQKVCKELQCAQIPFDIISEDYVLDSRINESSFEINGFNYDTLIIGECTDLPAHLIEKLNAMSKHARIIYINSKIGEGEVIELTNLASDLKDYACVQLSHAEPKLTVYPYQHESEVSYMFFNEDLNKTMDVEVTLPCDGYMGYDAYINKTFDLNMNGNTFHLHLAPYEAYVVTPGCSNAQVMKLGNVVKEVTEVQTIAMQEYNSTEVNVLNDLTIHSLAKQYPNFSGTVTYTLEEDFNQTNMALVLEKVYEVVEVKVNGMSVGTKIAPNYIFDLEDALTVGKNKIEIITVNTLSRNQRDMMSVFLPLEPFGIVSSIQFVEKV